MPMFQTARDIAASADDLFAAFADPVRLARWWGPDGFTNTIEVFEFQAGGRWVLTMHGPDGKNYANVSEFTEVVPGQRVVIRHVSAPQFDLTIELKPSANGTTVTWAQDFGDPSVASAVRAVVVPANEQNLDRWTREVLGA